MTDAPDTPGTESTAQAVAEIIQRFGGIRPTAKAMRSPATTVQGWKRRGHIPETRIADLEAAAERSGITLERALLVAATGSAANAQPAEDEPDTTPDAVSGVADVAASEEPAAAAQATPFDADQSSPAPETGAVESPPEEPASSDLPSGAADTSGGPSPTEPSASEPATPEPAEKGLAAAEPPATEDPTAEPQAPTSPAADGPASTTDPQPRPTVGAAAPSSTPAPPATIVERRGASGVAWFAVLVGLVSATAAATSPLWAPDLFGMPSADRLQRDVMTLQSQLADANAAVAETAAERDALADQIAALENASAPTIDLSAIEGRLATLESAPPPTIEIGDLEARVAAIESTPAAPAVDLGPMAEEMASLQAQMTDLGTLLQSGEDGTVSVDLGPLEARLSALEGSEGASAAVSTLEAQQATLDRLSAALATAEVEITALRDQAQTNQAATEALVAESLAAAAPADLSTTVDTLQADLVGSADQLAQLSSEVEGLTLALATTEAQAADQRADIGELQTSMAAADAARQELAEVLRGEISQVTLSTGPAQAFALAVSQLQEASRTGAPFPAAQATVQALASTDTNLLGLITPLAAAAATGVPTAATLASSFVDTAEAIRQADAASQRGGWVDQSLSAVTSIVTIRRTSVDSADTGLSAVLDRAADRLDVGDVAGAIEALAVLDGTAADAAAGWIALAEGRVALDIAMAALADEAIDRLSGIGG